ncbi:hypothetical protein Tdes44962_MAKER01375 [Teratosphaeria destructans]|uniref:Small secreted protein n=1 Tax=Teratosphaeria destructans TaxID=418781 RepID=A0A9W7T070_9PEZI|nr:hypothetical protein Tdes44962_MAKER01375 [Teratosphaeria destructans]
MPQTKHLLPIAILTACAAAANDPTFAINDGTCNDPHKRVGYLTFDPFKKKTSACFSIAGGPGHSLVWQNVPDRTFPCYGHAYGDAKCSWEIGKLDGNYDNLCWDVGPWIYSMKIECYRTIQNP